MPLLRQYNIFISHSWAYSDNYVSLEKMLASAPLLHIVNYSAPRDKPLAPPEDPISKRLLKEKITEKIRHAQVVIVIAGMWVKYSEWVNYEISEALRMKKPVLCVLPFGQMRSPADRNQWSSMTVRWNTDSIVFAIRHLAS